MNDIIDVQTTVIETSSPTITMKQTATPVITVRAIYNPHNIDSCLAVAVIAERIKQNNQQSKVHAIPVDYASHDTIKSDADYLVICGVSLNDKSFLHEIDMCNPSKIIRFSYLHQDASEAQPSNGADYVKINPIVIGNINDEPGDVVQMGEEQVIAENSISFLANEYFHRFLNFGDTATELQSRLMSIVTNYINFGKFASIWETDPETKKVSVRESNDLAFLYRNVRGIRKAAENGMPHAIPIGGVEDAYEYKGEISRIRKIIHRNLQDKTYNSKNKFIAAKTVCVGEDDALEVMRQLNHSFSTAITYEDTSNFRIWRIITSEQQVVGLLKEILQPTSSWVDCKVTYLSCELPKVNEKIQ